MSDLQVSLLIIGAVVVGGVTAFNWFQQWRLRRRLENAFGEKHEDVLLREEAPAAAPARVEPQLDAGRVEPTFEPAASAAPSGDQDLAASLPPVPTFDPEIDYIVALDAAEPISAAGLAELHTKAAACGRRFRVVGYSFAAREWEEAARLSGGRYAHLKLALQLVNRTGPVDLGALTSFCAAAQECAERFSARASCADIEAALARARDLDAFCAEVDVAIGVNIVSSTGKLAGTRIRALAEAAGFKLEPQGVFHYQDENRETLFTLDNHEPAPFLPEQIKHLSTTGVTLLLDVPRVGDGYTALDRMITVGADLARGLGGTLVDDNKVPLSDASVRAIRQQLKAIYERMAARGLPPGSARALRLFS
ncbi:MAG TPA: cell division protein ZipA C-terminal FtsZ-binding domain-containing protein [Burkholderiales bacterium]|nr:cell division protein ZipA C-terminal FtsZ-binding domain-containing protein [Burkholderiales bacterium]